MIGKKSDTILDFFHAGKNEVSDFCLKKFVKVRPFCDLYGERVIT